LARRIHFVGRFLALVALASAEEAFKVPPVPFFV
jgi:hypothetical protein